MGRKRKGASAAVIPGAQTPAPAASAPEPKVSKAKKEIESIEDFDVIDGFVLENPDKLQRVLEGEVRSGGSPEGGLITKYGDISKVPPSEVLAHYDKLAGLITTNVGGDHRVQIKTGSFWDMKKRCPRKEPAVIYVFRVGGEMVEVDDPLKLASALTTISETQAQKEQKNAERKRKAKEKSLLKVNI